MLCLGAYLRVRPVIELHLRTLTNGTDDKRNARSLGRVLARLPERSPEFAVWEGRARVSPAAALPLGQALLEPLGGSTADPACSVSMALRQGVAWTARPSDGSGPSLFSDAAASSPAWVCSGEFPLGDRLGGGREFDPGSSPRVSAF